MRDGPRRPVTVEHFQAESQRSDVLGDRRERVGSLLGQQTDRLLIAIHACADKIMRGGITESTTSSFTTLAASTKSAGREDCAMLKPAPASRAAVASVQQ